MTADAVKRLPSFLARLLDELPGRAVGAWGNADVATDQRDPELPAEHDLRTQRISRTNRPGICRECGTTRTGQTKFAVQIVGLTTNRVLELNFARIADHAHWEVQSADSGVNIRHSANGTRQHHHGMTIPECIGAESPVASLKDLNFLTRNGNVRRIEWGCQMLDTRMPPIVPDHTCSTEHAYGCIGWLCGRNGTPPFLKGPLLILFLTENRYS